LTKERQEPCSEEKSVVLLENLMARVLKSLAMDLSMKGTLLMATATALGEESLQEEKFTKASSSLT
jgi:hypothetical protein